MVMCSMVAAAKDVKIPWFPDAHTTVLFKTAPIRHDDDRNGYPSWLSCTPDARHFGLI